MQPVVLPHSPNCGFFAEPRRRSGSSNLNLPPPPRALDLPAGGPEDSSAVRNSSPIRPRSRSASEHHAASLSPSQQQQRQQHSALAQRSTIPLESVQAVDASSDGEIAATTMGMDGAAVVAGTAAAAAGAAASTRMQRGSLNMHNADVLPPSGKQAAHWRVHDGGKRSSANAAGGGAPSPVTATLGSGDAQRSGPADVRGEGNVSNTHSVLESGAAAGASSTMAASASLLSPTSMTHAIALQAALRAADRTRDQLEHFYPLPSFSAVPRGSVSATEPPPRVGTAGLSMHQQQQQQQHISFGGSSLLSAPVASTTEAASFAASLPHFCSASATSRTYHDGGSITKQPTSTSCPPAAARPPPYGMAKAASDVWLSSHAENNSAAYSPATQARHEAHDSPVETGTAASAVSSAGVARGEQPSPASSERRRSESGARTLSAASPCGWEDSSHHGLRVWGEGEVSSSASSFWMQSRRRAFSSVASDEVVRTLARGMRIGSFAGGREFVACSAASANTTSGSPPGEQPSRYNGSVLAPAADFSHSRSTAAAWHGPTAPSTVSHSSPIPACAASQTSGRWGRGYADDDAHEPWPQQPHECAPPHGAPLRWASTADGAAVAVASPDGGSFVTSAAGASFAPSGGSPMRWTCQRHGVHPSTLLRSGRTTVGEFGSVAAMAAATAAPATRATVEASTSQQQQQRRQLEEGRCPPALSRCHSPELLNSFLRSASLPANPPAAEWVAQVEGRRERALSIGHASASRQSSRLDFPMLASGSSFALSSRGHGGSWRSYAHGAVVAVPPSCEETALSASFLASARPGGVGAGAVYCMTIASLLCGDYASVGGGAGSPISALVAGRGNPCAKVEPVHLAEGANVHTTAGPPPPAQSAAVSAADAVEGNNQPPVAWVAEGDAIERDKGAEAENRNSDRTVSVGAHAASGASCDTSGAGSRTYPAGHPLTRLCDDKDEDSATRSSQCSLEVGNGSNRYSSGSDGDVRLGQAATDERAAAEHSLVAALRRNPQSRTALWAAAATPPTTSLPATAFIATANSTDVAVQSISVVRRSSATLLPRHSRILPVRMRESSITTSTLSSSSLHARRELPGLAYALLSGLASRSCNSADLFALSVTDNSTSAAAARGAGSDGGADIAPRRASLGAVSFPRFARSPDVEVLLDEAEEQLRHATPHLVPVLEYAALRRRLRDAYQSHAGAAPTDSAAPAPPRRAATELMMPFLISTDSLNGSERTLRSESSASDIATRPPAASVQNTSGGAGVSGTQSISSFGV